LGSTSFADLSSQRKRFTVDDVYRMMDTGILEGHRCELIDGDIIEKMAHNPPHAFSIGAVQKMLIGTAGFDRIRAQLPIRVEGVDQEFNEPQPDLAILASADPSGFAKRHPNGSELALAIEVADSTLRGDPTVKRALYASSSVPEYWVLDLHGRQLFVHRQAVNGQYQEVVTLTARQSVGFEGAQLAVASMLPPA